MVLWRTKTDAYPFTEVGRNDYSHARYRQYYKGLLVESAVGMVHYRNSKIRTVNVTVAEGLDLNVTPSYTEMQARTAACNSYPSGTVFAWQDSSMEAEIAADSQIITRTYFPSGQLLIINTSVDGSMDVENFKLAWRFTITTVAGQTSHIYLDAHTGVVLREDANSNQGTANLLFMAHRQSIQKAEGGRFPITFLKRTRAEEISLPNFGFPDSNVLSMHWAIGTAGRM